MKVSLINNIRLNIVTVSWLESLNGRDHSEDLGVDARIILEWILEKQGVKVWTEFIWLRTETSGGLF
jgi:hypothetical protein